MATLKRGQAVSVHRHFADTRVQCKAKLLRRMETLANSFENWLVELRVSPPVQTTRRVHPSNLIKKTGGKP